MPIRPHKITKRVVLLSDCRNLKGCGIRYQVPTAVLHKIIVLFCFFYTVSILTNSFTQKMSALCLYETLRHLTTTLCRNTKKISVLKEGGGYLNSKCYIFRKSVNCIFLPFSAQLGTLSPVG